jgi:3-oxoacyl-[acyl-carrier-protein] synthase-1
MFIGAENIISPLGNTAKETFERMKNGENSIKNKNGIFLSSFSSSQTKLFPLMVNSISDSISNVNQTGLVNSKTLLIVSTTKGEINSINLDINKAHLSSLTDNISSFFNFIDKAITLSTACVSGLQSLIVANDMLNHNYYDNVIICGGDLASKFVIEGFTSFYALSNSICKPFDKDRKGLNLGEAVSTIIMSKNKNLFNEAPFRFLGGCSINDANHISAPHREAEGLIKSINNTLEISDVISNDIDFINAHGTATGYNDGMEAKAFLKLDFNNTPINSFKGFFGHTLGAAGVIEIAVSLQSMRNNLLLKCKGFDEQNFEDKLDILKENRELEVNTILKTSSGFGGFNASAIIQKI